MVKPVVFQISGFQNSRKTTMVQHIVNTLSLENYRISTIKHHGHGGKPDVANEKDSTKHISAGAFASLVEGDGRLVLQAEKQGWDLHEQIMLLDHLGCDIIIVEGHKYAEYPKAVLLRDSEDEKLLSELSNIKVIFCHNEELIGSLHSSQNVPVFAVNDPNGVNWLLQYLKSQ